MTGLIDTLERDGYVKREPDPVDRRQMSVRLTPAGERFLMEFLPGHFKAINAIMSTLTEAERKTLVRILGKVQEQAAALAAERQPSAAASIG
jgi:DNA-binding MarR family transcriptional regulator